MPCHECSSVSFRFWRRWIQPELVGPALHLCARDALDDRMHVPAVAKWISERSAAYAPPLVFGGPEQCRPAGLVQVPDVDGVLPLADAAGAAGGPPIGASAARSDNASLRKLVQHYQLRGAERQDRMTDPVSVHQSQPFDCAEHLFVEVDRSRRILDHQQWLDGRFVSRCVGQRSLLAARYRSSPGVTDSCQSGAVNDRRQGFAMNAPLSRRRALELLGVGSGSLLLGAENRWHAPRLAGGRPGLTGWSLLHHGERAERLDCL